VLDRMTLNLSGLPDASASAATADLCQDQHLMGKVAGAVSPVARQLAQAIAAVYPVVQLLPVTSEVRMR
jgi:hypothetical protein